MPQIRSVFTWCAYMGAAACDACRQLPTAAMPFTNLHPSVIPPIPPTLVRFPSNHWWQGGNLWEGDIEDVGGNPCVVCPLHRYRISLATGQHMNPCGGTCDSMGKQGTSMEQKQRTYAVNCDDTFIW